MNQSETFPEIDLNQWEERVKKELKTPHTFESLQWQVSEFFSLNPVYDEKVFENENLEYLKTFHQYWLKNKNKDRADILAFGNQKLNEDSQEFNIAESYNFQRWVYHFNPKNTGKLPFSIRNPFADASGWDSNSEIDPLMDGLLVGKWKTFSPADLKKGTLHIHASDIHNAGGSAVQELAAALLVAETYKNSLGETTDWAQNAIIHLGIGPLFWLELAKIRAMRMLYINFCSINNLKVKAGNIRAETSKFFWSKTDSELNLLRHSTEVMSSILGGADQILVYPHSFESSISLDSNRLAVNIPLLAFEESQLHTAHDPAAGSYILELLTHKLAKEAWTLFSKWNEIGFEKMVKENQLQSLIRKNSDIQFRHFMEKKIQMVGVNVFTSPMAKTSPKFPVVEKVDNPEFSPLESVFLDA